MKHGFYGAAFRPAEASVFSYSPLLVYTYLVPPPVTILAPESGATADIGENKTSASVSATLTSNPSVIDNPDFYSSADPWLCLSYSGGGLDCYWMESDAGASGGVARIYGVTSSADYGLVLQPFTVPIDVDSFNVSIRWMLASTLPLSLTYLEVIVYDLSVNETVYWYNTTISTTSSYTTTVLIVDRSLYSDHQYRFYVGVYVYQYFFPITGTVDFRVDYADITITGVYPSFDGELIRINTSQAVQARLVIESITYTGEWNGTITLEGDNSSTITITGSAPDRTATDWVQVSPVDNPLYVSGKLASSMTATPGSTLSINATIQYRIGGVLIQYPINIQYTS